MKKKKRKKEKKDRQKLGYLNSEIVRRNLRPYNEQVRFICRENDM